MLERCIASVAAQTYSRIEHIVVDGGSSPPVLGALDRAEITFVSEPDRGQTNAINKGFAMAGGDLLGWLNADDTLRPDAVERVVATLRQHPAAGWAYGDCEVVGGRASGVWKAHSELTESLIRAGEIVPQPGSFVWRFALAAVGPLDESFDFTMDADMFLRLIDGGYPTRVRPRCSGAVRGSSRLEVRRRDEICIPRGACPRAREEWACDRGCSDVRTRGCRGSLVRITPRRRGASAHPPAVREPCARCRLDRRVPGGCGLRTGDRPGQNTAVSFAAKSPRPRSVEVRGVAHVAFYRRAEGPKDQQTQDLNLDHSSIAADLRYQ